MKKMIALAASAFAIAAASPALAQDTKSPTPAGKTQNMELAPGADSSMKPALKSEPSAAPRSGDSAAYSKTRAEQHASTGRDWRASRLIGSSIVNASNELIGDINDLLVGADGKVSSVVVGVGGFLGIGEKNVALPFSELSFSKNKNGNTVVMSKATKKTLEAMPEWQASDRKM